MVYVGDIYIQTVSELNSKSGGKDVTEVNGLNMVSTLAPIKLIKLKDFKMSGAVYTEDGITDDEYAENIDAIKERTDVYNYINYADTNGFVEVTSADVPKSASLANEREYDIQGKFSPASQYERTVVLDTEQTPASLNDKPIVQGMPPFVALPIGAINVKIKSPYQVLNIMEPSFYIDAPAGRTPVYQPFPIMSPKQSDSYSYGFSAGGSVIYDNQYYNMCCAKLDGAISNTILCKFDVNVGIDIPRGTYKLCFKMRCEGNADASKAVAVSVYGTTSDGQKRIIRPYELFAPKLIWDMYETATDIVVTDFDELISIALQTNNYSGKVYIEYAYLLPTYSARIGYETSDEYKVSEVSVYDFYDGKYHRVHSKNHEFKGIITIGNTCTSWLIDPNVYWQDTGYLQDAEFSRTFLKLYPYAFAYDTPKLMFGSILPNEVKFQVVCDVGRYSKTKMVTDVTVTPYAFIFDVHKINQYKNDWVMEADEQDSDFNYFKDTFTVKDSFGNDDVTIADGIMYCYFKFGSTLYLLSKNTEYNFTIDNRGMVYINGSEMNDYDYKFMLAAIPLESPTTCYSDNIFSTSKGVGGMRGQTFNFSDYFNYTTDIKKWMLVDGTSTLDGGKINMEDTSMVLKGQKFNESKIIIKSRMLL